jgi:hypothetical protein
MMNFRCFAASLAFFFLLLQTVPAQVHLQLADSIVLQFPGKPLDQDTIGPEMVFLDNYLLLFLGDFETRLFKQTDMGYDYVTTIKLWSAKGDKVSLSQPSYYEILEGKLYGIDAALNRYGIDTLSTREYRKWITFKEHCYLSWPGPNRLFVKPIGDQRYNVFVPVMPTIRMKVVDLTDEQLALLDQAPRMQVYTLDFKRQKPKLQFQRQFGTFRKDQGVRNNYPMFRFSMLTAYGEDLFVSSYSSDWIWRYDLEGNLVDSIEARGASLPANPWPKVEKFSSAGFDQANKGACFYYHMSMLSDKDLIFRAYSIPKSADQPTQYFLQFIDTDTKQVLEIKDTGRGRLSEYQGKLARFGSWNYAEGKATIHLYDVHRTH